MRFALANFVANVRKYIIMTFSMNNEITRLAPSPTGALHLGNARTFVINHLLAMQNGWKTIFRMEDLDGPRVKIGAADQAIDDLRWLGITWQDGVLYQSDRTQKYLNALEYLKKQNAVYPCVCSRKDIKLAASAPHIEDHIRIYPGSCYKRFSSESDAVSQTGRPVAWRLRVTSEPVEFIDNFAGKQSVNLASEVGDFVVFRNEGLASYQLAVVVDDHDANVTQIVRGDDLLDSAARQIFLRKALGFNNKITYTHLPLVVGEDGFRLAKRHGDSRIAEYRKRGISPERILGMIAFLSGQTEQLKEISIDDLLEIFDYEKIPKTKAVFTKDHETFLLN